MGPKNIDMYNEENDIILEEILSSDEEDWLPEYEVEIPDKDIELMWEN